MSANPIDVEQFLINLKIHLLRMNPFYGHVLQQLPVCYSENETPTLAVGKLGRDEVMVRLFINPRYVEHIIQRTDRNEEKVKNHFVEVLRHEVHHLIFQHLTYDLPDADRLNIACELSDNSYIDRNKLVDGDKAVFPEDYELEKGLGVNEYYIALKDNAKFNSDLKRWSSQKSEPTEEEDKLGELAERQDRAGSSNDSRGDNADTGEAQDEQQGISDDTGGIANSIGDSGNGKKRQSGKDGTSGGFSDEARKEAQDRLSEAQDLQNQAMDDLRNGDSAGAGFKQHRAAQKIREAQEALENDRKSREGGGGESGGSRGTLDSHDKWKDVRNDDLTNEMVKDIIRQANETCKLLNNWGDLPGSIREAIDDCYAANRQIVPWEVVLKNFLASASENVLDYTMKRKSKRYDTRPGTKKDDILSVAVGIDTSGSIDNTMLKVFFNELQWMQKTGVKMTVFEWDTRIHREYDFREYDGTVSGRGGTDPTEFLETVSERKFDCVITFTDMYFANITKQYHMPMLWVVDRGGYDFADNDQWPCEDGIIMKVNKDRDGFEVVRR